MEKLSSNVYPFPEWIQPKTFKNNYELRSSELLLATLDFQSGWSTLATAAAADGSWIFKRVGFFNMRTVIWQPHTSVELGDFRSKWTGTEGTLKLANGNQFIWKTTNFWASQHEFQSEHGMPLIYFNNGVETSGVSDLFKTQARVRIQPAANGLKDLSLLVLLGWYLIILQHQDSAAAAA